ncbi:MAG: NisI/SpaI family lantibiotic immunity lipoprotein [Sedimentibacter sp.]
MFGLADGKAENLMSKFIIKKKIFILTVVLVLIVGCVGFFGCSSVGQLVNNAKKNTEIDKTLPVYDLNKENFKEISYDGKTYQIMEDAIKPEDLDTPVGKVSQRVTIDENNKILYKEELMKIYVLPDGSDQKRIDLNFGWVYSIKDTDSDKTIAVVVNEKYRKAVIKE